jgi:hypothetical protein
MTEAALCGAQEARSPSELMDDRLPYVAKCFRAIFRPVSIRESFEIAPPAGRRADFEAFPIRIRPTSGPEARLPAGKPSPRLRGSGRFRVFGFFFFSRVWGRFRPLGKWGPGDFGCSVSSSFRGFGAGSGPVPGGEALLQRKHSVAILAQAARRTSVVCVPAQCFKYGAMLRWTCQTLRCRRRAPRPGGP